LADAHVPAVYPAKGFVPSRGAVESQRMSESPLPDSNRRPLPYHDTLREVTFSPDAAETLDGQHAQEGLDLRRRGPVGTRVVPGLPPFEPFKQRTRSPSTCTACTVCVYCGEGLEGEHHHDHAPVPWRHGGREVVAACVRCHKLKDTARKAHTWPPAAIEAADAGMGKLALRVFKLAVSMLGGDDCDPLIPRDMALDCMEGCTSAEARIMFAQLVSCGSTGAKGSERMSSMTRQDLRVFLSDRFCGCGSPEAASGALLRLLRLHPLHENRAEFDAWMPDDGIEYLLLYMLDGWGLTEHGGSVAYAWLTSTGEAVRDALVREESDEFEVLHDNHCVHGYDVDDEGHDCTVADREAANE
jgi:hypothetical protein